MRQTAEKKEERQRLCVTVLDANRVYKSSSSLSSSGTVLAVSSSACQVFTCSASTATSGGSRAGASTNWQLGSPVSLRVMYRKGFSKL